MERFPTSDGVAIAYEYDDSAPAGLPPIVLLHDFAYDAHLSFGAPGVLDGLADAGRRTIAVDLRGHGASDGPTDPAVYGEPRMAQDVIELLHHLDLERYDLVGYGMGAIAALLIAAEDPRVRRVVAAGVGRAAVEQGGIDRTELPPELLVPALQATSADEVEHPFSKAWHGFATTLGGKLPALAAQAQAMHAGALPLGEITAPVLVLAGDGDNLARDPQLLAGALSAGETHVLEGTDHLNATTHEGFVPAVAGFLAD